MIRKLIYRLNEWYNTRGSRTRIGVLLVFCLVFLLTMWLTIRYISFDAKTLTTKVPAHIGRPSGPQFKDSITFQNK